MKKIPKGKYYRGLHARSLLIKEIRKVIPRATALFVKKAAVMVERTIASEASNSIHLGVLIRKAISLITERDSRQRKLRVKNQSTVKKPMKRTKPVKRTTRKISTDDPSYKRALKMNEDSQKYWIENGGERYEKPVEIRSNKIYPSLNDHNNDMGSQLQDESGFAPIQQ